MVFAQQFISFDGTIKTQRYGKSAFLFKQCENQFDLCLLLIKVIQLLVSIHKIKKHKSLSINH